MNVSLLYLEILTLRCPIILLFEKSYISSFPPNLHLIFNFENLKMFSHLPDHLDPTIIKHVPKGTWTDIENL